jgi:hypothetical protein
MSLLIPVADHIYRLLFCTAVGVVSEAGGLG